MTLLAVEAVDRVEHHDGHDEGIKSPGLMMLSAMR
jgi:hypothetical protein